ncbi:hypothetical protein [Erythrobacter sp. HKB08]|uniref:hypothetical protein n=1 Tax=Erythrobacter sp. HKB08 TaxID=2502843 RepID=UPI0010092C98|nr:hypothetical protein [Erythrobacter sp. HKB08]
MADPTKLFARRSRMLVALLALGAACCAPPPPPIVQERPRPVPTPTPTPTPPPAVVEPEYDNWADAPQTPGDWSYVSERGETLAIYGVASNDPAFILRCNRQTRRVGIARVGAINVSVPMRIRTETEERLLTVTPLPGARAMLTTELDPNDRLLDAMAFSRGRFAVETAGLPTLYLPSWPEVTRVIEDCR